MALVYPPPPLALDCIYPMWREEQGKNQGKKIRTREVHTRSLRPSHSLIELPNHFPLMLFLVPTEPRDDAPEPGDLDRRGRRLLRAHHVRLAAA